ncbi:MAG TPA: ABC transporter permease [Acidobacteriaceae bacterium]|jgi:predicted permease|nr:ABC transporter permease [Acidobacteriaceae bacterium]
MQTLRQDIAYALRQMRLSPVFTLTAMLTLALGIGATTAIFSLIDTVMLKSLPVADPSSLYRIGEGDDCCVQSGPEDDWGFFSYDFYRRMQQNAPEFSSLAAFQAGSGTWSVRRSQTDRLARPLRGEMISGNYFSTFGLGAFLGRAISPSDDQPNSPPVAMLSYRTWQQQYGSDASVVGSTFIINDHPVTVIGITPPGFFGETLRANPPDLWLPLNLEPTLDGSSALLHHFSSWLRVVGRLRPGASVATTGPRMTALLRHWLVSESGMPAEWMPGIQADLPKQNIRVVPAGIGVAAMKEDYSASLRILITVCCLVLLIACANIANLLLARGASRRTQTSIRLALGASRKRLIRQTLTESIVLSVLGGVASLAVAYLGVKLVVALAFRHAQFVPISAAPSLPVLGFAFALALVTGILFGTVPAWLATHADPADALRGAGRSTRDHASWPQKALVIVQASLSVVLLAGAGLLTRSLVNLQHQDFGYQLDHRITINLTAPWATYSQPQLDALYRELQGRLAHIPGVERAALAQYTPLTDNWGEMVIRQGHGMPGMNDPSDSSWDHVAAGYLETLGEPILRGRSISEDDTASTQNVAVVNEAFVQRFFKPGENPLGQHFGLDLPRYSSTFAIVGVVGNAKYVDAANTEPARPLFFVPLAQHSKYADSSLMQQIDDETHFIEGAVLEVHGSMEGLEPQIRQVLSEVDPNLTLLSVRTLEDQVDSRFDQQRAVANMTGLFGILALVLAAVGLYGVTAYTVARRTGEIGLRMALGADRASVIRLVLRGAFLQVAIGLGIGVPAAMGCARLIASQLYHVHGWDPMVLGGSILTLGVCALAASIIPAQRAASIDPVKALRVE